MTISQTFPSDAPGTIAELNLVAKGLIQENRYAEARAALDASLALGKNPVAYRYIGVICRFSRQLPEAIRWFEESLKISPNDSATLCQLAEAFFDGGDMRQACAYYAFAIRHDPANIQYMERFIALSERVTFVNYNEVVEQAIATCLKASDVNASPLQSLWFNTFQLNPAFKPLYAPPRSLLNGLIGKPPEDTLPRGADLRVLLLPFFLLGLRHLTVLNLGFEAFVSRLRRTLFQRRHASASCLSDSGFTLLAAALSHYAYNTEYIFAPSVAETADAAELAGAIALHTPLESARLVALYACYMPLSLLSNAPAIEMALRASPIADVIQAQLTEHYALQASRKTIPAITGIDDEVSLKVQEQYEESPYPKWGKLPKGLKVEKPAVALKKKGAQILVAGCGTGHEALQYAVLFPDADVLAVDLSLTSMAYGIGKAAEFGISNISFRQADILRLGELGRQFDCVVSGGVLHHIRDMFGAWQVLASLLAPGGIMKIALYSKTARRRLLTCHEIIKKDYPGLDLVGMRRFRHDSEKILGKKIIASLHGFEDYYHLSMYRDMMFHVQERNLDLTEIGDMLQKIGLAFVEFSLPQPVLEQYSTVFPADPPGGSLANWQAFEEANPDTFKACYIFWCRKKAAE